MHARINHISLYAAFIRFLREFYFHAMPEIRNCRNTCALFKFLLQIYPSKNIENLQISSDAVKDCYIGVKTKKNGINIFMSKQNVSTTPIGVQDMIYLKTFLQVVTSGTQMHYLSQVNIYERGMGSQLIKMSPGIIKL